MFKRSYDRENKDVLEQHKREQFEVTVMPHLAAAYNLARWLARNNNDAEDIVQESYLRAYKFFGGFRGGDGRAWLLTIVRHTCYSWFQQNRRPELIDNLDDAIETIESDAPSPEAEFIRSVQADLMSNAIEALPAEFREVIILREMEGLSYKEIAEIIDMPLGTVMSRLSRARKRLQQSLSALVSKEA